LPDDAICEYPVAPKSVAYDMTATHLLPNGNGEIVLPDAPGLGIEVSENGMARYLVDVEISAKGKRLYETPRLSGSG
jgi:L-alanine-DL-glutamate epimerase-like enolase superfamily enzyme